MLEAIQPATVASCEAAFAKASEDYHALQQQVLASVPGAFEHYRLRQRAHTAWLLMVQRQQELNKAVEFAAAAAGVQHG